MDGMLNGWNGKRSDGFIEETRSDSVTAHLLNLLTSNSGKKWLAYKVSVPEMDPLACIEDAATENLFYWEKPDEKFAIAAGGAVTVLRATGSGRFRDIGEQTRQLKHTLVTATEGGDSFSDPVLVGGYSFSDHNVRSPWKEFGAARFVLPEWTLIRKEDHCQLILVVDIGNRPASQITRELDDRITTFTTQCERLRNLGSENAGSPRKTGNYRTTLSPSAYPTWEKQVNRSRELIRRGFFEKIVISRQLQFETDHQIEIPRAMHHLRRRFPNCFNFMIHAGDGSVFMGATPERLISLKKNRILTEGLAGSISRGESAIEDLALEQTLMKSRKERSEHNFVVEDIRNNLKQFVLRVDPFRRPVVKKLHNVQHLYTPISAEIRDEVTIHELAGSLHPTPAVGGFPKADAVPYINEIECADRGWYAGPVGWFTPEGAGEFAVAIRSARIEGGKANLYAGSGIVRDSDPMREWEETEMKFLPVLDALKRSISQ